MISKPQVHWALCGNLYWNLCASVANAARLMLNNLHPPFLEDMLGSWRFYGRMKSRESSVVGSTHGASGVLGEKGKQERRVVVRGGVSTEKTVMGREERRHPRSVLVMQWVPKLGWTRATREESISRNICWNLEGRHSSSVTQMDRSVHKMDNLPSSVCPS